MTAPTREEVAKELGRVYVESLFATSSSKQAALAQADYVLGLIRDEREACAKVCDEIGDTQLMIPFTARRCAAAIRSRGAS